MDFRLRAEVQLLTETEKVIAVNVKRGLEGFLDLKDVMILWLELRQFQISPEKWSFRSKKEDTQVQPVNMTLEEA